MIENINKLGELIKNSNKILLINHIRMDIDAFGSLSAFYDVLNSLNKTVKAINDEKPLEAYAFTGYNHIIEPELNIKEYNPDLIISFDAASKDQLGETYKNNLDIFNEKDFVVIDHHKTNPGFGKYNIVNPEYSSTCELVFDICKTLDFKKYLTAKSATSLISGIYTDTNVFYNSNTTANTHRVTAELMELGADFRKPYYEFYQKKKFNQSKLWGEILANQMKISDDGKIVWATVKKELFEKTNTHERQLTGLISEFFANIQGAEICFISHEMENGLIKTSFRSTEEHDVSAIASHFGGGGHKQASGCSIDDEIQNVEIKILEKIKESL